MILTTRENDPLELQLSETPQESIIEPAIAPAWHTVLLIAGILAISWHGSSRFTSDHQPIDRLTTYGATAAMELLLIAWVFFGLRLRKTPLRSLLGKFSFDLRSIAIDLGVALVFWFGALMVLGTLGVTWMVVESVLTHKMPMTPTPGQPFAPDSSQQQALHAVAQLAPSNAREIAAWALLCLFVGFAEELVFRGYLQTQFIRWTRGGVVAGVVFSALCFGGAHAYQGTRNMVLLAVFGALFSGLALFRRSLRAGMFAHSWHDLIAGLALALLKSMHMI